jgi:ribosomal protein S18 acetylase RimI-like enzyme
MNRSGQRLMNKLKKVEDRAEDQIGIRTLGVADYEAICQVWAASGVHFQTTGRESYENFSRQMASGLQAVFGAMDGVTLVGVVVVTHDGRKGWVNRLGVLPEYQRQGIGTRLVGVAEDHIHAQGLEIVAALIEHDNDASLSMFKRAGYFVHNVYYVTKRDHPDA